MFTSSHWQPDNATVCSNFPSIKKETAATRPMPIFPALWQKEKLEIYCKTSNNSRKIQ